MKKTLFAILLLTAFHSPFSSLRAQEDEYRIEQAFPVAIRQLSLMNGWTVKLIYTPGEDSTRVTVVTPCPYFFKEGNEPLVCTLRDDKLAIHQNRTMPLGTLLEVRYPEPLEIILSNGHIELDTVHMLLHSEGPRAAGIIPGTRSSLKIGYLVSEGDLGVDCRYDHSSVEIGTVRCRQFLVDEKQRDRVKVEHLEADSLVVVPHHWWHDINWNYLLLLEGKIGFVTHTGARSPYTSTLYCAVEFNTRLMEVPITKRWKFYGSAGWGFDAHLMAYDVIRDGDRLIFNPSPDVNHDLTLLEHAYLSVPLTFQYRTKNRWARIFSNHLDFTLTPRLNIIDQIGTPLDWDLRNNNINILSRFQLRFALANTCLASNDGDILSDGITWEIFVDLLPTYRPSADAKGLHQIGFVLHF